MVLDRRFIMTTALLSSLLTTQASAFYDPGGDLASPCLPCPPMLAADGAETETSSGSEDGVYWKTTTTTSNFPPNEDWKIDLPGVDPVQISTPPGVADGIADGIKDGAGAIWGGIKDGAGAIWSDITDGISAIFNWSTGGGGANQPATPPAAAPAPPPASGGTEEQPTANVAQRTSEILSKTLPWYKQSDFALGAVVKGRKKGKSDKYAPIRVARIYTGALQPVKIPKIKGIDKNNAVVTYSLMPEAATIISSLKLPNDIVFHVDEKRIYFYKQGTYKIERNGKLKINMGVKPRKQ